MAPETLNYYLTFCFRYELSMVLQNIFINSQDNRNKGQQPYVSMCSCSRNIRLLPLVSIVGNLRRITLNFCKNSCTVLRRYVIKGLSMNQLIKTCMCDSISFRGHFGAEREVFCNPLLGRLSKAQCDSNPIHWRIVQIPNN